MKQNKEAAVQIFSFGYKYGVPENLNLLFDVRFLQNPYYDTALRPLCGLDKPVRDFMEAHGETREFYEHTEKFALYYIEEMIRAGRAVSVAFGCTGGRHRSVYFAQALYEKCRGEGYDVRVLHRDLGGLI